MFSNTAKAFLPWMAFLTLLGMATACNAPDRRDGMLQGKQPPASPQVNRNLTGELQPPQIGDEEAVKRPPPEASNQPMPVIPPPGTPGGDPNIQPK
jgi:hypothetical protein